jgi:hypothetical protein
MVYAGSSVESDRGPAADLVLHVVYIVGLLTFAAVLGIVCDDIGTQVDKVGGLWSTTQQELC